MIFGLLYFCVVILCVNRSRSSFILYRIVKRHSRQSNVRRIWTCADNADRTGQAWSGRADRQAVFVAGEIGLFLNLSRIPTNLHSGFRHEPGCTIIEEG